jgi:hypothetical protein
MFFIRRDLTPISRFGSDYAFGHSRRGVGNQFHHYDASDR